MTPIDPVGLIGVASSGLNAATRLIRPEQTQEQSFAQMLLAAQRGKVQTARPVAMDAGLAKELGEPVLRELSAAVDAAEAAGADELLVLVGDKALRVDVADREVTAQEDPTSGILTGIDSVVRLDPDAQGTPSGSVPSLDGGAGYTDNVLRLIDSRRED